jgi:transposase
MQKMPNMDFLKKPNRGKNSSNKQREMTVFNRTLRHEGQSIQIISRTLKVFSSAVTKTIKRYDETGSHEDHHRKGRSRVTSAAENKFINFLVTGGSIFTPG